MVNSLINTLLVKPLASFHGLLEPEYQAKPCWPCADASQGHISAQADKTIDAIVSFIPRLAFA